MRLLPRDEKFFDLFSAVAKLNVEASRLLQDLLRAAPSARRPIIDSIKRLEHQADQVTHEVVNRLDRSFITPLDREDIHTLASRLDDVMDVMDGTARRVQRFHAGEAPRGALLMAQVITRANVELQAGVTALQSRKNDTLLASCVEVKHLEEEGDTVYHEWTGKLFEGATDALHVMKWKEIYDTLEKALDRAEDAANVLESISIKHA